MAFSINGLIENITGSVQNLMDQLAGKATSAYPYPTDAGSLGKSPVLNKISQANWAKLPAPYSFAVIGQDASTSPSVASFLAQYNPPGVSSDLFGEFQLPLAPGKITQTEHFAVAIKSTQGGTVVSHSGNKYKTLTISGTTGIAPFRGSGGVNKQTGEAIFQPNQLKYKSGYEVFLQLRNYFKAYYEYKKVHKDAKAQALRLVWKNYKDGEFLIVELLDFQMDRTAPRSFLYDYNLTFKVLAPFDFTPPNGDNLTDLEKNLQKATSYIDTARGVFLRSQDILRQVEATYEATVLEPLRKVGLAYKAFQGIGATAADVSSQAIRNTMTALAAVGIIVKLQSAQDGDKTGAGTNGPQSAILARTKLPKDMALVANNPAQTIIDLGEALTLLSPTDLPATTQALFAQEQVELQTLPRSFFINVHAQLTAIQNNAEDFFGLGSPAYDKIFNRTSTITPNPSQVITDAQFDVLDGFNQALTGLQAMLASDAFFKSPFDARIQTIIDAFAGNIDLQADLACQQIILSKDTDLERLALAYLGDPNRWPEIAELNDLRAPYIIQDQSDKTSNVKHPGETILIPANPTLGFSKLPVGAEITAGPQLDALEKNLGADLKLTENFDLALGNDGDLQVVQSGDNMAQAVVLKLAYEPGELIDNPTIGVGLDPGVKFPNLGSIQENLVRSLLQDPRISGVSNLSLNRDGDELILHFDLGIKHVDTPIPLDIKV